MLTVKEVEFALEAAKTKAAREGENLQNWYYYVSPNQQPVHLFRDAEEKHLLQVVRAETTVSFARQVSEPDSDVQVEGIALHYNKNKKIEILSLIVAFFLDPERTYEAVQNGKNVERFTLSVSEVPHS
jgi:hypothetical protein